MKRANLAKTFPGVMETIMALNDLNQVQVSEKTGIAVSRVNNYLHGKYRTIRPDHVDALLNVIAASKTQCARMVEAYVMDLLPETAKGQVAIKAEGSDMKSWYLQRNRLPNGFAALFEELYMLCVSHPKVRSRTGTWAEIMKESLK